MDNLHRTPGAEGVRGKPLQLCPNCAAYIIAAIWSEQVSERCVRNVWSCESCGFEFETSVYFPAQRPPN